MSESVFRTCTCGAAWATREAFSVDPDVVIIGYTPNFEELKLGWFFFNHETCHTTFAVSVSEFADMAEGPVFKERLLGTPDCPGYCVHRGQLSPCPQHCECAWVRGVLQKLRHDITA